MQIRLTPEAVRLLLALRKSFKAKGLTIGSPTTLVNDMVIQAAPEYAKAYGLVVKGKP